MASYPSKPWTNGQTHEVVPGETYKYDATQAVWKHVTKATLDSDYQVNKASVAGQISTINTTLTSNASTLSTHTTQISQIQSVMVSHKQQMNADSDRLVALTTRVSTIELLSDSEAGRVEQQIARINIAFGMLDSDGLNMQAIKTALDLEIAATNSDVTSLQNQINTLSTNVGVTNADHDSDIGVVNGTITALAIPIVSATQPTGKAGQLWINTNDNKLYFWNGVDAFVTIATV